MRRHLVRWAFAPRDPRPRNLVILRPALSSGAVQGWRARPHAKRWSAVSDGGEDQGAEEVTVQRGRRRRRIITSVLERAVSRERLFLAARPGPSRPSTQHLGERHAGCFFTAPRAAGLRVIYPWGATAKAARPTQPRTGTVSAASPVVADNTRRRYTHPFQSERRAARSGGAGYHGRDKMVSLLA